MNFGYTEIGVVGLIVLVALTILGAFKLHSRMGRKYLKRMLAGNLYEDYRKNHKEDVVDFCGGNTANGRPVCYKCKSDKIWMQIVIRRLDKSVTEHKCRECGTFLFYSCTGFDPGKL